MKLNTETLHDPISPDRGPLFEGSEASAPSYRDPGTKTTGVKCLGCTKPKPIVTHVHGQGLCSACNNLLRRHHGKDYAYVIENPAAAISLIRERKESRRDMKVIRKAFFTLTTLVDDFDLPEQKATLVFRGFGDVFVDLKEASSFLTLDGEK
jgi:hypothetical protein